MILLISRIQNQKIRRFIPVAPCNYLVRTYQEAAGCAMTGFEALSDAPGVILVARLLSSANSRTKL